jgi:hypothetical protein
MVDSDRIAFVKFRKRNALSFGVRTKGQSVETQSPAHHIRPVDALFFGHGVQTVQELLAHAHLKPLIAGLTLLGGADWRRALPDRSGIRRVGGVGCGPQLDQFHHLRARPGQHTREADQLAFVFGLEGQGIEAKRPAHHISPGQALLVRHDAKTLHERLAHAHFKALVSNLNLAVLKRDERMQKKGISHEKSPVPRRAGWLPVRQRDVREAYTRPARLSMLAVWSVERGPTEFALCVTPPPGP